MNNIWFVSDQHYGHANIIKYASRPFKTVDEMNSYMIRQHNDRISNEDKVYFLGDVAFSKQVFETIMPALNGKKRLILGNHDKLPISLYQEYFNKFSGGYSTRVDNKTFHFTHYPATPQSFNPNGDFYNVHGHIHEKVVPDKRYINISVEHTDYAPVDMEWILRKVKSLQSKYRSAEMFKAVPPWNPWLANTR